jgi:hypothetical protein
VISAIETGSRFRQKSGAGCGNNEDTEFATAERIQFDTEDLRRRAGIGRLPGRSRSNLMEFEAAASRPPDLLRMRSPRRWVQ